MSFDTLFMLIILLLLAVAFPLMGVQDYRLLLRRTREGEADARVKFYKAYLIWLWPLTIGLVVWWLFLGNGLEPLGLIPVAEGRQWVTIGVGVFVLLAQVMYLETVSRNVDKLAAIKEQMGSFLTLSHKHLSKTVCSTWSQSPPVCARKLSTVVCCLQRWYRW